VAAAISAAPALFILLALALSAACVKNSNPVDPDDLKYGMIEIRARLVAPPLGKSAESRGMAATVPEKLVIEISGDDLAPVRVERKVDFSRPTVRDTAKNVPVGKNRRVEIWAVSKNGVKTHIDSVESRSVTIEAAVVAPVYAALIPAAGSIYLQFTGTETTVARVHASFTSLGGDTLFAENTVTRQSKTFLSLDNIPHLATGILRVAIITTDGDTSMVASRELTFDARANNTVDLQFIANSGMLGAEIVLYASGVTTGSYDFKTLESAVVETGELIITEIMWSAGNENYIELYNPGNTAVFFDTLTTVIDVSMGSGGAVRDFMRVTIAPKSYFVIGRSELPYADVYTPTTAGLPLAGTGNWIAVKRGRNGPVADRVISAGTNSATGWPPVSGTRSVELSRDKYNAADNNFGNHWSASTQPITPGSERYGTPGR
jgi:hypothetical protein